MITKQDLLDAGYKYSYQTTSFRFTHDLYQKRIRNEHSKTRYLVNVWWYAATDKFPDDSWEAEVQFTLANGEYFNVQTHCWREAKIVQVEAFFDAIHDTLGCRNYDHDDKPESGPAA